jgi:hypothetical protein
MQSVAWTFLVLKYLSKRRDLMAAPIRLSIATALVKHPTLRATIHHSQHTSQSPDQSARRNVQTFPNLLGVVR